MKAFKYSLDRSSKKFHCPYCNRKTFVRFVDVDKKYLDHKYGRCDREDRCGYFLKPNDAEDYVFLPRPEVDQKPISFIPKEHAIATFKGYEQNNLFKFLITKFGANKVSEVIRRYRVGIDDTSWATKDWTIFWQFDINGNIRSGKMINYGTAGKRSKEVSSTWYHKRHLLGKPVFQDFNLKQCLFGEHLINVINKPIAIVESEKTALIASIFIDRYLWLACGGLNELRPEKVAVLMNRSVTLFPDLGCFGNEGDFYRDNDSKKFYVRGTVRWHLYNGVPEEFRTGNGVPKSSFEKWKDKSLEFGFNISDSIENIATDEDRALGLDIADFLLR